jgi:hypothetical protein
MSDDPGEKVAVGVICTSCGFVHMFAGGDLRWDRP